MSEASSNTNTATRQQQIDDPAQYWGYLFQRNKAPADILDRLLRGIATCIVCPQLQSPRCLIVQLIDMVTA